ncbi:MAG: response regulator transcription factor [Coriobacteriales bacterium]|jgi:two-component system response regulator RegX3|nr:response regulator transcription factor [Coriobacteriales bacterium]
MPDTKQRILVVDDELSITEFVSYNLKKEGYEVEVAQDGDTAVKMIEEGHYNLVILDVMLPGIDGYEVLRKIRPTSSVPVLFLSARDTELDKVVGLELGGDDYLAKPFGVHELLARVKVLLRRGAASPQGGESEQDESLEVNGIHVDTAEHSASYKGQEIDLTPREFELLATMMQHAGKVVSRDQLLREAWGWETVVETKTVDTHIKRLRDKLESVGIDPGLIETVRGYGYKLAND